MHKFLKTNFFAPLVTGKSMRAAVILAATCATLVLPVAAQAQNLFSPAVTVNDSVVTHYELEQRALFMRLIGAAGDPYESAREELIKDRLKRIALLQTGITATEEDVITGMTELAGRANLSLDEFLKVLGQNGIAPETLRDYTKIGLEWRDFVGARFLSRARPTEEEIDRAMGTAGSGGVQVLISEIIIPITEQNVAAVEDAAEQISQIRSYDEFSAAASQVSAADSREDGGRLPWMALTRLPPQLQEVVLALDPGEVTAPMPLQGAVALFQMRGIREVVGSAPTYAAIEYVTYFIAGGRSPEALGQAQAVMNRTDTCDDFYGIAKGQDPAVLERHSLPPRDIPQDIAIELASMDPGEKSAVLTRNNGQTLVVLMLCGRTADLGEGASRETVANALTQQRLAAFADSYVEQLRADALIEIK